MEVAEERSINNAVARGGQGGGEQAKAERELTEEGGMIMQQLSGAFPKGNHSQMCLWCCSRTLRREPKGTL